MPSISDPLVLPKDVTLVPVSELGETARTQLGANPGDVAVSRANSRTHSKIISADSAELVRLFTSPLTIAEAILRYSRVHEVDPHVTLEGAFPLIRDLINDRLLVTKIAAEESPATDELKRGTLIGSHTVVERLRHLEDTELYQVTTPAGTPAVIKMQRLNTTKVVSRQLAHEAAALRWLEGDGLVPRLIEQGEFEGRDYLAIEWCEGVDIARAAGELREVERDWTALLRLCVAVLDAYTQLHTRGLLHGDIHPGNILVDAEGRVRLIDFGLARSLDPARPLQPPFRGGVSFFLEPEYAAACLAPAPPPEVSTAGEQYGLAVLIYSLLTGAHYVNFSLESETAFRQIVHDPPLPFSAHKVSEWPEVEAILRRALDKQPQARFASISDFAAQLRGIADQAPAPTGQAPAAAGQRAGEDLLKEVLRRAGWEGDWFKNGLTLPPTASVNYGAAGLAYFLYRAACIQSAPALLTLADVWISRALQSLDDPNGFYNEKMEIAAALVGQATPYHTASGVRAVQFLIAHAMGDMLGESHALDGFVHAAQTPCKEMDVALGRSGVLLISALLYDALDNKSWAEQSGLLALGNAALDEVWARLQPYRPIGPACELRNLGAAHGWAGMLYAVMRWCQSTGRSVPDDLPKRLRELESCAEPVDRGRRWVWEYGHEQSPYMPGWCNGTTGQVLLWTLAARMQGEDRFLNLAIRAGWNVWEDSAQSASLCCGLAGRGYALLHLYRVTQDHAWRRRACHLAYSAVASLRAFPVEENKGYEHSLYKADVGVASLIADLAAPETAVFPFFESEYAPS